MSDIIMKDLHDKNAKIGRTLDELYDLIQDAKKRNGYITITPILGTRVDVTLFELDAGSLWYWTKENGSNVIHKNKKLLHHVVKTISYDL